MLKIVGKRAQKTQFLCYILQQILFNKTRYEYIQKIAEKRAQKTVPLLNTATKSNKTRNEYIQKIARKKSTKSTIPLLNTATNFFNKTRNEYIQKIAGKIAQKTQF